MDEKAQSGQEPTAVADTWLTKTAEEATKVIADSWSDYQKIGEEQVALRQRLSELELEQAKFSQRFHQLTSVIKYAGGNPPIDRQPAHTEWKQVEDHPLWQKNS